MLWDSKGYRSGNGKLPGMTSGDATAASDVDLIVTFDTGRTLMDHAALIGDLEDLLGVKVDVIDADGMRPRFRDVVEREAVSL
ncbi:MAG TPA: nucleotidyltransferase domain-containing protein [Tepidisphaeraceae bacterium]|nr:nucleotidyltransferase domain-containing protein [Tepidisphaeraceae bacterium]